MGSLIIGGANNTGAHPPYRVGARQRDLGVHAYFSGNMSALTIDIEGRILGGHPPGSWTTIGQVSFNATELSNRAAYRFFSNVPVDEVRGNITSYNGTGIVYCAVKDVP